MSQLERVEKMLLEAKGPVCGTTFLRAHIPRYAARIHELRRQGWVIERRQCNRETHAHRSPQFEYDVVHP